MRLPFLSPGRTVRMVTDVFRGYNHNLKIADGEMFDTENLSSDFFPLLARRQPRVLGARLTEPSGLLGGDRLIWVDGDRLFVDGEATELRLPVSYNKRQLVRFGSYVVIFPDNLYYNLSDPADRGSLDASVTVEGTVRFAPCNLDGAIYTITSESETEPQSPQNGELWLNTAERELLRYSVAQGAWVALETVYTKLLLPCRGLLPPLFRKGDGVEITGLAPRGAAFESDMPGGVKTICAVGADAEAGCDYLVVIGLVPAQEQDNALVRIERAAPAMDFVIECRNRLWGCRFYDGPGAEPINELYCSALGDFKNWRQYQGLSTDSWAASVGAPGTWTGAVNYLGRPTFFKEDRAFVVSVSAVGGHRVEEISCRGVERGSERSLCVVGETLYYKAGSDVMAWQGGFPVSVSGSVFGCERYCAAVGGAAGGKYYLSMSRADDPKRDELFVYDIARALWLREDALGLFWMAEQGGELWAVDTGGRLLGLTGAGAGEREGDADIPWRMESGILYYEFPDKKYVSRYNLRLQMAGGAEARIFLEYDSSGAWRESGTIRLHGTGTVTVPIRPRRCDHLRMKLEGRGAVKLLSVARVLELGSDV